MLTTEGNHEAGIVCVISSSMLSHEPAAMVAKSLSPIMLEGLCALAVVGRPSANGCTRECLTSRYIPCIANVSSREVANTNLNTLRMEHRLSYFPFFLSLAVCRLPPPQSGSARSVMFDFIDTIQYFLVTMLLQSFLYLTAVSRTHCIVMLFLEPC